MKFSNLIPIQPNKQESYQVYRKLTDVIPYQDRSLFNFSDFPNGSIITAYCSGGGRDGAFVIYKMKSNCAFIGKIEQGISFSISGNDVIVSATGGATTKVELEISINIIQNLSE